MNPDPLTLRELVLMAEARVDHDSARTANLMAMIANCHRDPKKSRPFKPEDFYRPAGAKMARVADVEAFRHLFVKRNK